MVQSTMLLLMKDGKHRACQPIVAPQHTLRALICQRNSQENS